MDPRTTSADKVLVVDDEPDICRLVVTHLRQDGFSAEGVGSGSAALDAARRERPTVAILDLNLPDIPGGEVCKRLRADPEAASMGILILTARGDDEDRVIGFEIGADDYVVKPFNVREVVLRVRALARRCGERRLAQAARDQGKRLRWCGLEVDPDRHRVFHQGTEVELRPIEFKLVSVLMEHPGRVFTREQLLNEVWGIDATLNERTVDVHVRRLRQRLGAHGDPIETVHGVGYRLRES